MTAIAVNPLAAQSLARGAAGAALLDIERAMVAERPWRHAHAQIAAATSHPVNASAHAGLYYGAPAISFILHCAQADGIPRYQAAADRIAKHVRVIAEKRLHAAAERMTSGEYATFAEYDLFYGLTGFAALLLRTAPGDPVLGRILAYLVRLSLPRPDGLPGWWVGHDPDPSLPTAGGHANLGAAHGMTGILAILAASARRGVASDRQHDAIAFLSGWLMQWQQDSPAGPWWPHWITRAELASGRLGQVGPGRASWCYGTPAISRALQQAAIVLADTALRCGAEDALAGCLSDPAQIGVVGGGLCHGIAGIYQTAWRAASDATNPGIARQLPYIAELLRDHAARADGPPGLLDGATGLALALRTAAAPTRPPASGWDACLLID